MPSDPTKQLAPTTAPPPTKAYGITKLSSKLLKRTKTKQPPAPLPVILKKEPVPKPPLDPKLIVETKRYEDLTSEQHSEAAAEASQLQLQVEELTRTIRFLNSKILRMRDNGNSENEINKLQKEIDEKKAKKTQLQWKLQEIPTEILDDARKLRDMAIPSEALLKLDYLARAHTFANSARDICLGVHNGLLQFQTHRNAFFTQEKDPRWQELKEVGPLLQRAEDMLRRANEAPPYLSDLDSTHTWAKGVLKAHRVEEKSLKGMRDLLCSKPPESDPNRRINITMVLTRIQTWSNSLTEMSNRCSHAESELQRTIAHTREVQHARAHSYAKIIENEKRLKPKSDAQKAKKAQKEQKEKDKKAQQEAKKADKEAKKTRSEAAPASSRSRASAMTTKVTQRALQMKEKGATVTKGVTATVSRAGGAAASSVTRFGAEASKGMKRLASGKLTRTTTTKANAAQAPTQAAQPAPAQAPQSAHTPVPTH